VVEGGGRGQGASTGMRYLDEGRDLRGVIGIVVPCPSFWRNSAVSCRRRKADSTFCFVNRAQIET